MVLPQKSSWDNIKPRMTLPTDYNKSQNFGSRNPQRLWLFADHNRDVLYDDIQTINNTKHYLDLGTNDMFEDDVRKYPIFWTEILYDYFLIFRGCERSRSKSRRTKRNVIISAIYEPFPSSNDEKSSSSIVAPLANVATNARNTTGMDLRKSEQSMMSIIPAAERLVGDETKPFTDRLEPVLYQI